MKQQVRNKLHGKAGFTLVELIVVIAILGILAGIGTVGYSGYMKKAHQAADLQMSGDVNYALQLYGVSNNLGLNQKKGTMLGYVLLTEDAPVLSDPSLGAALTNMFGSGYNSALKLQYDNWTPEMLSAAAGGAAESVTNSSYVTGAGTDKLLGDVQKCTTGLSGFMNQFMADNPAPAAELLAAFFGADKNNAFKQTLSQAGYTAGNGYAGITTDALSNATVFAVADYVNDNTDLVKQKITTGSITGKTMTQYYDEGKVNIITTAAIWYASMEAMVSYLGNPTVQTTFDNIQLTATNPRDICQQMDQVMTAISNEAAAGRITEEQVSGYYTPTGEGGKSQAELDAEAFVSIMNTVNDMSDQYSNAADLNNASLMTDSSISDKLNSYVAGAAASGDLAGVVSSSESSGIVYLMADGKGGVTGSIDMVDNAA